MIEYIKGRVAELEPTAVTVDTPSGLGYLLSITLATYSWLEARPGETVRLWVHESVREDAWTLYGFAEKGEREMFRLLVGVSGIGAGTARVILSALSVDELRQAILGGDHMRLKAIKGIGLKTAQRLIVDLRDKVSGPAGAVPAGGFPPLGPAGANPAAEKVDDAVKSLVVLGYAAAAADRVVRKLLQADASLKVDQVVRQALALL